MSERPIVTNVVSKEKLRVVQSNTLKALKDIVKTSFGPMGSHSIIAKKSDVTEYTKDGHTILSHIDLVGLIEESIKEDMVSLTRKIVKTVGDGTTSAVMLSSNIFEGLKELEENNPEVPPYELVKIFQDIIYRIKSEILKHNNEVTPDDIYKIAMISTNGNNIISQQLQTIYEKFGNDVFIDVSAGKQQETLLKSYDGMTLESGYSDIAYVNTTDDLCRLRNPRLYVFSDPVDTPEMVKFFDKIIVDNIYSPLSTNETPIPTVILAPKISSDFSVYMENLITNLTKFRQEDLASKPPVLVITNIYEADKFSDISIMCGCKPIKKYINPDIQKIDIEKGLAPTPDTIHEFAGTLDVVESSAIATKFINPSKMFEEDGKTYSKLFLELVATLENAIKASENNDESVTVVGNLKRRLQSLKSNMVEIMVGGATMIDRDNTCALVEDAVLNCRSAARNGFGYGANFEGLRATNDVLKEYLSVASNSHIQCQILKVIFNAYRDVIYELYRSIGVKEEYLNTILEKTLEKGQPYNIRTKEYDNLVLSSIDSDRMILDVISRIITLMITAKQFICPAVAQNQY